MPTFGTVPIGEARANTVTGQRAALLQEYAGFIQGVPSGQAGKLEPGEGETTQAIRRRLNIPREHFRSCAIEHRVIDPVPTRLRADPGQPDEVSATGTESETGNF